MRRYIATLFRTFAAALILGVTALSFPACDDKPIEVITTDYGYALTVDDVKLGQTGELLIRITSGGTREETVTINYKIDDDLSLRLLVNGQTLTPGSAVQFDLTNQIRLTLPELPAGRHVLHLILTNKYEKSVSRDIAFNVIKDKVKATRVEAPSRVRMVKGSSLDTTVTISPADADILEMTALTSNPDVVKASVLGDGAAKTLRLEAGDAAGEARVDLRHEDFTGAAATVAVEVFEYVISGLRDLTLTVGGSETLRLAVTPSADISLSASNGNVSVFPEGNNTWTITGVRAGSTVLTASAAGATATCAVTVRKAEETIAISPMGATIASGSQKTFTVSSSSDWAAELSSDDAAIVERTATTVTVRNDNRAFTDSRVTLTVVNTADATKKAVADIRLDKRPETISLIETSSEAGRVVYEVAGDFDGWKIQSSPAGLKAQAAGTAVILTNETYKTIRGRLVVRTTAQGVDAVAEVSVPGLDVSLSKVTLAPTSFTVEVGSDLAFSATGTYSDGSTKDLTQSADWTCSSNLQMTAPGRFSAVREGDAWVRAAIDGKEGRVSGYVEPVPVVLSGLEIDPASFNAYVDETKVFTATASYSDGSVKDVTSSAAWTASGPASASGKGSYRMTGTGDVVVTVSFTEGGKTLSARSRGSVTIPSGVVSRVEISPASASAKVGETLAFTGTVYYTDGQQDSKGTFTVTPAGVLSGSAGNYTAQAAGTATVTFSAGGKTASARATVLPADVTVQSVSLSAQTLSVQTGATGELTASAQMSDGSMQDVTRSASWTSSNPSVATVSAGTVRGVAAGTATITATYGGRTSGACSVRVEDVVKVTAVALSPASLSFTVGDSPKSLKASAVYNNGKNEDVTYTGTWASSNTAVATVSASGLVSAKAAGSAEISCTYGGIRGTAPVTVIAVAVTPVSLTLNTTSLEIFTGDNASLKAMVGFSDGSTNDYSASCTWTSSNSNVVAVDRGNVRGLAAGNATVTATYSQGGKTVTATCRIAVTDRPATLESLSISPSSWTMAAATEASLLDFSVRAQFSDGSSRDVTSQVVWSIPSGTYYAEIIGTTLRAKAKTSSVTVQAAYTYSGVSKTATFTLKITEEVKPKALAVNPKEISLITGKTWSPRDGGASLAVTYTDGTTKTISAYDQEWNSISWSVKNTSIAYFNGQTLMTQKAGSTQIVASYGGLTAEIALTVTDAVTLSHITVSPASLTLKVGESGTLSVTAHLTDNSSHTATSCQWTSSNQSVAYVSGGNVTARGAGSATITASYTYTNEGKSVTKTADVPVTVLVPVSNISIDQGSSITIEVGETMTLNTTVTPSNAADKSLKWEFTSGKSFVDIAKTATDGSWIQVTGKGVGSARLTATSVSTPSVSTSVSITVKEKSVPVSYILFNPADRDVFLEDYVNKPTSINMFTDWQVQPTNATDKTVTWKSSNEGVAFVNGSTGQVTVYKTGTTRITATSVFTPSVSATFTLNVKEKPHTITVTDPVSGKLEWATYDQTSAKTVSVSLENVSSINAQSNNGWFKVQVSGSYITVTPQGRNETTSSQTGSLTITDAAGKAQPVTVSLEHKGQEVARPDKVEVSPSSVSMNTGDSKSVSSLFSVTVKDQYDRTMTDQTVRWSVGNASPSGCVSLSGNTLSAYKAGSATLTASCGSAAADVSVTVSDIAVESIVLDKTSLNLMPGGSETLTATVLPTNATDMAVTWSSNNSSVARVNNGNVTAVTPGDAVITASAGGKSAICSVHVIKVVESVTIVDPAQDITTDTAADNDIIMQVRVSPADADNVNLKTPQVNGQSISYIRLESSSKKGDGVYYSYSFHVTGNVGTSMIRFVSEQDENKFDSRSVNVLNKTEKNFMFFTEYAIDGYTATDDGRNIPLVPEQYPDYNQVKDIHLTEGAKSELAINAYVYGEKVMGVTSARLGTPYYWSQSGHGDLKVINENASVARLVVSGKKVYVEALSAGTTKISLKSKFYDLLHLRGIDVETKNYIVINVGSAIPSIVTVSSPHLNGDYLNMGVGDTETLTANVRDQSNNQISNPSIEWSSGNTSVATVSGTGSSATLRAVATGYTTITARCGNATATINVNVTENSSWHVDRLVISPSSVTLSYGETKAFTATAYFTDGSSQAVSKNCTWFFDGREAEENKLETKMFSPGQTITVEARYTDSFNKTVYATATATIKPR